MKIKKASTVRLFIFTVCGCVELAMRQQGGVTVKTLSKFLRFVAPSEVVVFLLNVIVRVLETECFDVMGDVGDTSVEFLRS